MDPSSESGSYIKQAKIIFLLYEDLSLLSSYVRMSPLCGVSKRVPQNQINSFCRSWEQISWGLTLDNHFIKK